MAKKKTESGDQGSIFDHFARMGLAAGDQQKKDNSDVDVAKLLEKIAAQDTQIAELRGRTEGSQYPMLTRTEQPSGGTTHHVDPSKLKVDLTGLPDRMEDPEGYDREYTTRVNAAMAAQTEAVRAQLTQKFEQERASEKLWNGFKAAHPEWAQYETLVETTANRVVNDLQARGVDLQRFMVGTPDKFYNEIAGALKQQYGKLIDAKTEGEETEEEEETPSDDPSRVEGLGSDGKTATKGAPKGPSRGADMFDDLRAVQRRMGLI